jgi:hypothetical protein
MAKTSTAVTRFSDAANLPAHLSADAGLGNEHVSADDMQIPHIKILQKTSPQVESIEGAKPGMFINTLDNKLYTELLVVNCHYVQQFTVFLSRDHGGMGNPLGKFPTRAEAETFITDNNLDAATHDISQTGRHVLMILDKDGNEESQAIYYMSSTAFTKSQNWNSQIAAKAGARFAGVWKLSTEPQSNKKGSWATPTFEFVGWADQALYDQAKTLYTSIEEKL